MPFQSSRPLPRALWRAERAEVRQGVATRGTVSAIAFTRTALRPPETVLRARRSAAVGPALEPETGAEACSSIQPPGGSSSGNPGELDPFSKGQPAPAHAHPSPAGSSASPPLDMLPSGTVLRGSTACSQRPVRVQQVRRGRQVATPVAHAQNAAGSTSGAATQPAAPSKCPFALAASFMLAEPRPPKLSPLGEVVFSPEPAAVPTPHLWYVVLIPLTRGAT